jgi:hypothetical protein
MQFLLLGQRVKDAAEERIQEGQILFQMIP